ncbi:hypothetical protein SSCG_00301 [Streptomyces clavuligerus]|nr:hypothetical protein SSCG_00301 [Streptomyces clavuligerus]
MVPPGVHSTMRAVPADVLEAAARGVSCPGTVQDMTVGDHLLTGGHAGTCGGPVSGKAPRPGGAPSSVPPHRWNGWSRGRPLRICPLAGVQPGVPGRVRKTRRAGVSATRYRTSGGGVPRGEVRHRAAP